MIKNHFTATGIVFNSKSEVLMVKHNKLKVWLPPGGHIDENELPCDAALRETFEETGVRARLIDAKPSPILSTPCCKHARELVQPFVILLEDIEGDGTHNHIDLVYLALAESDDLQPQLSEVDDIGWFSQEQFGKLDTFDNVAETIVKAYEYIQQN